MPRKKSLMLFALPLLALVLTHNTGYAQWWINGSTPPDLQTDPTGTHGTFGIYNNVIIDNYLSVNFSSAPTCTFAGATTTGNYPLVVNVHDNPMVLWDNPTSDIVRRIVGMSPKGGVALLSGDDYSNGTGILLRSSASATLKGSVSTISNGDLTSISVPLELAFCHSNYNPSSGGLTPLFSVNKMGNMRIGSTLPTIASTSLDRLTIEGSLGLSLPGGSDVHRNIFGRSLTSDINVSAGSRIDGYEGACLTAIAQSNLMTTTPGIESTTGQFTPGAFIIKSNAPDFLPGDQRIPLGFAYQNITPPFLGSTAGVLRNIFLIRKNGQGIFGEDVQASYIVANDVFTVKSSIGMYDKSDDTRRYIDGNTNTGMLSINAGTNSTDGSTIEMYGANHAATPSFQGRIHYNSWKHPGERGHLFQNWDGSNWVDLMAIYNDAHLQTGNYISMDIAGDSPRTFSGNSNSYWLGICSGHGGGVGADGSYIQMFTNGYTGAPGTMLMVSTASTSSGTSFVYEPPSGPGQTNMTVRNDGAVIIGNVSTPNVATPTGYRLYVQNGILTEQVRVAVNGTPDWADYVFDKGYKLMSLNNVEKYIKTNNHLPDVPSAEDVVKDGVNLGKMDAKLLQKIEELTLYVIDQQKRIDELEQKIGATSK